MSNSSLPMEIFTRDAFLLLILTSMLSPPAKTDVFCWAFHGRWYLSPNVSGGAYSVVGTQPARGDGLDFTSIQGATHIPTRHSDN